MAEKKGKRTESAKSAILKVRLTFTQDMLGTAPSDPDVYQTYIAKVAAPDEIASLPPNAEQGTTVFHRTQDGRPMLYDYQIKGFFKDAAGVLNRVKGKDESLAAHKKIIDGLVFVQPRELPLTLPEGKEIGKCVRPLRAETAQGPRVALASSESVPAGTTVEFSVMLLDGDLEDQIIGWLDYGQFRGLGQWRNSGKGSFTWERV